MTKFSLDKDFIFDGMTKILLGHSSESSVKKVLNLLVDCGWIKEVFPELDKLAHFRTTKIKSKDLWEHTLQVVENCPTDPVLRWTALFHDVGKPLCCKEEDGIVSFHDHEKIGAKIWEVVSERISVPKIFSESVATIIRESGLFIQLKNANSCSFLSDKAIKRYLRRFSSNLDNVSDGILSDIFDFVLADITTSKEYKREELRYDTCVFMDRIDQIIYLNKREKFKPRLPKGTGNKLMQELGLQGKSLGVVMKELQNRLEMDQVGTDFVKCAKLIINEFKIGEK